MLLILITPLKDTIIVTINIYIYLLQLTEVKEKLIAIPQLSTMLPSNQQYLHTIRNTAYIKHKVTLNKLKSINSPLFPIVLYIDKII